VDGAVKNLYVPVGTNLLGDFDAITFTSLSGSQAWDTGTKRSGTQSLKLSGTTPQSYVALTNVTPGKTYLMEAWVTSTNSSANAKPEFRSVGVEDTSAFWTTGAINQYVWTRTYALVTPKYSGTGYQLHLHGSTGQDVWIDDVSIRECIPITQVPTHRLLATREVTS
jgi:hypothetical protein